MSTEAFDVIVVGSGMGGAAAAYELVQKGLRVLMLEKGDWVRRDEQDWNARNILIKSRYSGPVPTLVKQYESPTFKPVPFNENVGGMSVFYGGAAFRLRERDLASWPVSYAEMEPWYAAAEKLLEVHGEAGADPCEPWRSNPYPFRPIPRNDPAQRIHQAACSLGFRPFHIPMAINFNNAARGQCAQCATCDGFPCKLSAKNEASTSFLNKLKGPLFTLRTGVIAARLAHSDGRVTGLEVIRREDGQRETLKAKAFVVAGGAIQSPALLLRSAMPNPSGLLGRRLMRHCNAVVAYTFLRPTNPGNVFHKQVALTDFYEDLRPELGTSVGVIQDIYTPPTVAVRHFAPAGLKTAAALLARRIQNLLCIAEDDPNPGNAVTLADEQDVYGLPLVKVRHAYSSNDYRRLEHLIRGARRVLRASGGLLSKVHRLDSFSHAVGTLRFGENEHVAVLDRDCRYFGMRNLFVVDGSFMPTSGGVNPSLTIAANALRVGRGIHERFAEF